ncbi:hypothetical protein F5X68DRAFT_250362 [Plectosphaerella plurivora]|uniref:NAD(P)-binding protein n=1 Tax=Plectosphaerella plurivora TaxID=936078 RepID=A0A9P8V1J0_9PEZI|nr:hypothetical protein F5X68DRAFT_250362 [Plectosphaerella plurivora]
MSLTQSMLEQLVHFPVLLHPGDCTDKVCIVTGSNIGIGLETAKHLVRCSAARVILAVRNVKAGEEAKAEIEAATKRTGVVEVWRLDLASFASVKSFAQRAITELDRLDILVENAAVYLDKWTISEGLETSVTVNVNSTMLLGALLMPKLIETGRAHGTNPRLTFVGSSLGFTANKELDKSTGETRLLDGLNDPKMASMDERYAVTKLIETFAYRKFSENFPTDVTGVTVNMVNPGLCKTGLARDARTWTKFTLGSLRAAGARSAESGSRAVLHAVTVKEESHGKFLSGCEIKQHWIPQWMTSPQGQKLHDRIWSEVSAILDKAPAGCLKLDL